MKCRLKNNLIIGGKLRSRGEVLDAELIPKHLQTANYVDFEDLEGREGKVMLLHGLQYTTEPTRDAHGQNMSFPVTLGAGELLNLNEVPERQRSELVEGRDYIVGWTEAERMRLRHEQSEAELKYFEPSPTFESYDV